MNIRCDGEIVYFCVSSTSIVYVNIIDINLYTFQPIYILMGETGAMSFIVVYFA